MELDEGWELIPEEGFLEIQYDGGKQIYSRKYSGGSSKCVIQRNHFNYDPESINQFVETTDTTTHHPDQRPAPIPITVPVSQDQDIKIKSLDTGADQDPVSQVFFKKLNETEFIADMKLESPRSNRGIMPPQVEGAFQFEGEPGTGDSDMAIKTMKLGEGGDGGLNIWKGIGAICSFGMAAATVCVIVLSGSHQQNKHKLQFQMYTNDKVRTSI